MILLFYLYLKSDKDTEDIFLNVRSHYKFHKEGFKEALFCELGDSMFN